MNCRRLAQDARYLVLKLSDGTFCHLFEDTTKTVPNLDAFAALRHGGEERRLDEAATVGGDDRRQLPYARRQSELEPYGSHLLDRA